MGKLESCAITAVGCEMRCPICHALIPNGFTHECERRDGVVTSKTFAATFSPFIKLREPGR